jgi:hypothetical protein
MVKPIFSQESSPKLKEVGNRVQLATPVMGRKGQLAELSAGGQSRTFRRNVATLLAAVPGCAPFARVQLDTTAKPGARTFLSAAAMEVNQRMDSRRREASGSCCGQECPRAGGSAPRGHEEFWADD